MPRSDRRARGLIFLLLVAMHLLLIHTLWRYLHPDRPAQPRGSRASITVVALMPPVAAPTPSPDQARRRSTQAPANRARRVRAQEPVYVDEALQAAVTAPVAPVPAPAASESARPLRLNEKSIRQAIADAEKARFRGMVKGAGRLDDIEPQRPNPLAGAVGGAAKPGWRAIAEARIAAAKAESCKSARAVAGGGAITGGTPGDGVAGLGRGGGGGIGGPVFFPFTTSNPNDCKK